MSRGKLIYAYVSEKAKLGLILEAQKQTAKEGKRVSQEKVISRLLEKHFGGKK